MLANTCSTACSRSACILPAASATPVGGTKHRALFRSTQAWSHAKGQGEGADYGELETANLHFAVLMPEAACAEDAAASLGRVTYTATSRLAPRSSAAR